MEKIGSMYKYLTIMKKLIGFTLLLFMGFACQQKDKPAESVNPEVINKIEMNIEGMSCTGCEETITKSALALEGVKEATASFKDGKAWITFDQNRVTAEKITAAIQNTGYHVAGYAPLE